MEPLIEHRLELAGFSTRALELEGTGPPIILLHGWADSADTWRLVLDRLARAGRAALAVDLPGFGAADPLRPEGAMLDQLEAFARAAVDAMAAEHGDVILAGNSLGGTVALRAAHDDSAPIRGVVPIAPAGLDMPRWFGIIERDPFVRLILQAPLPLPEPILRAAVGEAYRQLAFARPREAAREIVRAFTDHHRTKDAVARMLDNGRRLLPELDAPFELERIACPILLVWGDRDRMVSHRGARLVTEALPDTEVVLLEGVGHCPQLEAPGRVFELLTTFCADPSHRVA